MTTLNLKTGVIMIFALSLFFVVSMAAPSFLTDSENLKKARLEAQESNLLKPYDEKIKIFDAWNFIRGGVPDFSTTTIGIIDSGVDALDSNHPEFRSINFGKSGPLSKQDRAEELFNIAEGHGTQVAGIIGANNTSATSSNNYFFPQMNGIISGVTNKYVIESRTSGILEIATFGGVLSTLPESSIINLSIWNAKCSIFPRRLCVSDEDFDDLTEYYEEGIDGREDLLFVIIAGNAATSSQTAVPANINRDNTVIVGATDLEDTRAFFSNFGLGVNISAPGIKVYAPSIRGKGNFPTSTESVVAACPLTSTSSPAAFEKGLCNYQKDFSGTSAAAPMVTGVAAILKALEPEYQKYTPGLVMTPEKIKEILIKSADPIFPDEAFGSGCFNQPAASTGCRLNSHRAVAWQFPPASSTLSISTTTADSISLSWNLPNFDFKNPDFDSYKLFRSTSSPVNQSSTPAFSADATPTLSFTDEGLSPDTTYFYKLFTFDKAGLFSESGEISATTGIPTIPDIRGTYQGTAVSTLTNCQNPADNITISWPSAFLNIPTQSNGVFNATGTIAAIVNSDAFLDNFIIAGSVSGQGDITGNVSNTFFINNVFNSGGQGTFTGQFLNDILNLSFSTQDIVGDTCLVQGTLTAVRQ